MCSYFKTIRYTYGNIEICKGKPGKRTTTDSVVCFPPQNKQVAYHYNILQHWFPIPQLTVRHLLVSGAGKPGTLNARVLRMAAKGSSMCQCAIDVS